MSADSPPVPPEQVIGRLASHQQQRIELGLTRITDLLERLAHPERRLPPVIHIAGTNGKGSTLAFLRAMLEAAGLRVHCYTSPYLVHINECIRLGRVGGGVLVSDDDLNAALQRVEQANHSAAATVFELKTAAAFDLFARHPADILLLEVGLGGRLDSTNVIDRPLASVLTPISMDHTDLLGDTLSAIAAEKAAIIKPGVPVITAVQAPDSLRVIEAQARKLRAPIFAAHEHWHVDVEHGRLVYQDDAGLMDLTPPRLFGRHQFDNAALAIATLRAVDFAITQDQFEAGIVNAEWPARMQRLTSGPLLGLGPRDCEIWIDGGHNVEGGRVAAAALGDLEERVSRPLVLIAGMMANKDARGFIANFADLTRHLIVVPIPGTENALPVAQLSAIARELPMRVDTAPGIEEALRAIAKLAYEVPPRILITGSLYLAGHVLALNGTPPT
ncbi:MAG: bifunctional folylpolyglutamate synthase/dihydrofolate synthase [Alphaproteobacteria bacterium]|nr:bifunctional folylpolyglutamate synthase/dihydrofolate synthase [Alphaproteobacteria bacterium]